MEWVLKVMLTVLSVALVLALAQRLGRSAAGFVAGLPLTTAPALLWISRDRGTGFAADAAVVTVAGCAVLAAFALTYAHAAVRGRIAWAIACATVAAGLVALPALTFGCHLPFAAGLAVVCCGAALACWPRVCRQQDLPAPVRRAPQCWRATAVTAASAGGFSVGVALAGPVCGIVATGLLSSLPVVSLSVATAEHAAGGTTAVLQFMRGYVAGLFGRIAFGSVFAVLLGNVGPVWALAAASLCAGAVNVALARGQGRAGFGLRPAPCG